jgi:hypothetical protein
VSPETSKETLFNQARPLLLYHKLIRRVSIRTRHGAPSGPGPWNPKVVLLPATDHAAPSLRAWDSEVVGIAKAIFLTASGFRPVSLIALELGGEHDGAVDGDRETTMPATQHDRTDDELGEGSECTGQRIVGLIYNQWMMVAAGLLERDVRWAVRVIVRRCRRLRQVRTLLLYQ